MQTFSSAQYHADEFSYAYTDTADFDIDIPTHTHTNWEFLFVKDGALTYTVDGNIFDIAPNSLIISRPGAVHMLHPKGTIHYERHSFFATESAIHSESLKAIPQDLHVLDVSKNGIILGLYEKIGFYLANLTGKQLEKVIGTIIDELLINIYLESLTPSRAVAPYSNPVITNAIIFIKNNILEPLSVQQVSDALFITPSYLHRCFVKHMNITPKQYIMVQKLQLVQQALVNAANPTEICRYYGFRTYSTFYRNYQKLYGCRPSDSPQPIQKITL